MSSVRVNPTPLNIRPLGNRVIVRKVEEETSGGAYKPVSDSADDVLGLYCEVVELPEHSAAVNDIPLAIGSRVHIPRFSKTAVRIEIDGDSFIIVDIEEIAAIEKEWKDIPQ